MKLFVEYSQLFLKYFTMRCKQYYYEYEPKEKKV